MDLALLETAPTVQIKGQCHPGLGIVGVQGQRAFRVRFHALHRLLEVSPTVHRDVIEPGACHVGATQRRFQGRSEERRVGKGCVSRCSLWLATYPSKKKKTKN